MIWHLIIVILIFIIILLRKYIKIVYNLFKYNDASILKQSIDKKGYSSYEGSIITPKNMISLIIVKNMYNSVKHILIAPIENYVSFTRLNLSDNDRIHCDWCAIVNGFLKLYIDSIIFHIKNNNIHLIKNIRTIDTKICKNYIKSATIFRDKKITKFDIDIFIKDTFIKYPSSIYSIIYDISSLSLYLEQIELRWCPFKSMQSYFRNTNPNYVPINKKMIYEVGKILSKYDTIECIFCNKIIHESIDKSYISTDPDTSPMMEYYKTWI